MEDNFDKYWNALENADRMEADPVFLNKLENIATDILHKSKLIPLKKVVSIAASLLILISVNAYVLSGSSNTIASDAYEVTNEEYSLIPNPLI